MKFTFPGDLPDLPEETKIEKARLVEECLLYYNTEELQEYLNSTKPIEIIDYERLVNINIEQKEKKTNNSNATKKFEIVSFENAPISLLDSSHCLVNIGNIDNIEKMCRNSLFFSNLKKGFYTTLLSSKFSKDEDWNGLFNQLKLDVVRFRNVFITNDSLELSLNIDFSESSKLTFEEKITMCDYFNQYFYRKNIINLTIEEAEKNNSNSEKIQFEVQLILNKLILEYILGLKQLIGNIKNNIIVFDKKNYDSLLEGPLLTFLQQFEGNPLKSQIKKYVISMFNKIYNLLYLMQMFQQNKTFHIIDGLIKNLGVYSTPADEIRFIDKLRKRIVIIKKIILAFGKKGTIGYKICSIGYSIIFINFDPENPGSGFPITENIYVDFSLDELAKQIFTRKSYKYIKENLDKLFKFIEIDRLGKKKSLFPNLLNIINTPLNIDITLENINIVSDNSRIFKKHLCLIYNSTELKRDLLALLNTEKYSKEFEKLYSQHTNLKLINFKLINLIISIEYDIYNHKYIVILKFCNASGFIPIEITIEEISAILGNLNLLKECLLKNNLNLYIFVLNSPKRQEDHYTIFELDKISNEIFSIMNSVNVKECFSSRCEVLSLLPPYIIVYDNKNEEQHLLRLLLIMKYLRSNDIFIPLYFLKKLQQLLTVNRKSIEDDNQISIILASYSLEHNKMPTVQPIKNSLFKTLSKTFSQKMKPQLNLNINNSNQQYLKFLETKKKNNRRVNLSANRLLTQSETNSVPSGKIPAASAPRDIPNISITRQTHLPRRSQLRNNSTNSNQNAGFLKKKKRTHLKNKKKQVFDNTFKLF